MSPPQVVEQLGYPLLFLVGVLGHMGVPVPEKSALLAAGYLIWAGQLHAVLVIGVGLGSAVLGANLVYWLGRRLGRPALDRCTDRLSIPAARVEGVVALVARYGALGVFVSRFIPGARFLTNSLAGVAALRPLAFSLATACAALAYLPFLVGTGYVLGLRFGAELHGFPRDAGPVSALAIVALAGVAVLLLLTGRRTTRF
jgi:membrane protein DedA with SNARE-associated domain